MTIFNSFLYVYQRVSARTFRSTKRNCLGAGDLGSKKRSIWILQKRSLVAGSCMDYFVILLARSNSIMRGQWTGGSIHCSHVTAKTDVVQQHKPPHVDENHRSVAARVGYRDTDVRGASMLFPLYEMLAAFQKLDRFFGWKTDQKLGFSLATIEKLEQHK